MIPRLPRGFSHPMRIGEGAFASVYRVRQQTLDRWVAVKIVAERNRARRGQLLREARTQARIKSECIPQIYDAFEWNNNVCIVMQWIRGIPLSALIESPLSGQERFDLTGGFLQALASLHSLGFAHRDLKPANILISPRRVFTWLILDSPGTPLMERGLLLSLPKVLRPTWLLKSGDMGEMWT